MSNNIITRREAKQLHRAFQKTGGKFDTTASRLLTERLAAKVSAVSPEKAKHTQDDIKLAAAMVFKEGAIKDAIDKKKRILPYAYSYGHDKEYCLNGAYMGEKFWNYEIISFRKALKTSFSIRNLVDTLQESRQEKMRLAREAETAINGSLRVAQDSRARIAEDKAHEERLRGKPFGQR